VSLTGARIVLRIRLEKAVGALNSNQEELLNAARGDTERLLRIQNELLDLAHLAEGGAGFHRARFARRELLQAVVKETTDKAAARNLNVV